MGFMDKMDPKKQTTDFDISILTPQEKTELDEHIRAMVERFAGNRQEMNRLVFQSVSAMTMGDDYEKQLSSRRGLRRFIGSITGSNKRLQDKINENRSIAQYASQQALQRLAEQNAMSFDLITTVNTKLNASILAVEKEFVAVYGYLVDFFKSTRSNLIQIENRLDKLERNVKLLNWQNAIEYQVYNGMEYSELDDAAKIVCLARDFFDITQGEWTTSDLLLLKTAMATIDISPKETGNYFDLIRRLYYDRELKRKLLGGTEMLHHPDAEYLTMLAGIDKLALLDGEEHYIVASVLSQLPGDREENTIAETLTQSYLEQNAQFRVNAPVPYFDLVLELIYNLRQASDENLIGFRSEVGQATDQVSVFDSAPPATEENNNYNQLRLLRIL